MHKALHPKGDEDRLYVSRKGGGGRGLASIQDIVDALIQRFEDYIKRVEEDWLQRPEPIQPTHETFSLLQVSELFWLVGWVLWHINLHRLFNAKFYL